MKLNKIAVKVVSVFAIISFLSSSIFPAGVHASEIFLPAPNQFVNLSSAYSFPILKGLKFDPANPLEMEFVIDTADQKKVNQEEAGKLIKYFLAGLTIPENELWVNLSPFEKDRIITPNLSQTDLGKDLLSQDYILKQLSASLVYPESQTGKDFWKKTYEEVQKVAHTTNLPVNTYNKIWIVPDKSTVYENGNLAVVAEATLKTMLEQDYLALKSSADHSGKANKFAAQINQASSDVMRSIILPKINDEVNSGKNFATLRQIYNSLILGVWFKKKFQESIYTNYINKGKINGINLNDKTAKEEIYNTYLQAFTKGLYKYIKTDIEPNTNRKVKRQYFSGGADITRLAPQTTIELASSAMIQSTLEQGGPNVSVGVKMLPNGMKYKAGSSPIENNQLDSLVEKLKSLSPQKTTEGSVPVIKINSPEVKSITDAFVLLQETIPGLNELKASDAGENGLGNFRKVFVNGDIAIKTAEGYSTNNSKTQLEFLIKEFIYQATKFNGLAFIKPIAILTIEGPQGEQYFLVEEKGRNALGEIKKELDSGNPAVAKEIIWQISALVKFFIQTGEIPSHFHLLLNSNNKVVLTDILSHGDGGSRNIEQFITKALSELITEKEQSDLVQGWLSDAFESFKNNQRYLELMDTIGGERKNTQYSSWQEFEQKILKGKPVSQTEKNLAKPLNIAFNVDSFTSDRNVSLFGGVNGIFDSIFRLLEGNPNFAPKAIFVGDYAQGMPASFERLAEYLKSNPNLGNAKYTVRLEGNKLIINGLEIALYRGFADVQQLREIGIDFLVEATKQNYIHEPNRAIRLESKAAEEKTQKGRIDGYLQSLPDLKVVVISPEEDKDLGQTPVVYSVNGGKAIGGGQRVFVLAEPVTAVTTLVQSLVDRSAKKDNKDANRVKVEVSTIGVARTSRQGTQDIAAISNKAGLAVNEIASGEKGLKETINYTYDAAPISGANMLELTLRISGGDSVSAESLNAYFQEAEKKGLLSYLGKDTASGMQKFNKAPFVFQPVKNEDVKIVRPAGSRAYKTVRIRLFYTEYAYAEQALNLMAAASMFEGNIAPEKDVFDSTISEGIIPATQEMIIPQIVEDGRAIPIALNSFLGRISRKVVVEAWSNPNLDLRVINGVREPELAALYSEFDEVYGWSPFTAKVSSGKTKLILTDREERITSLKGNKGFSGEIVATQYGNLLIQNEGDKISLMILHGEAVKNIVVQEIGAGLFVATGKLKSGTTINLTYQKEGGSITRFASVGIKKQTVVTITNIRADKDAYKQDKKKGETDEAFAKRVHGYNQKLARKILAEAPDLVKEGMIFMDASGQMTEEAKLEPLTMLGAIGSISAPAKATVPGGKAADIVVVSGANTDAFLAKWGAINTTSNASCTTNALTTAMKSFLLAFSLSGPGYFVTNHATTLTQGGPEGGSVDLGKKSFQRGVSGPHNIIVDSTGASSEGAKVIAELTNMLSGVSIRLGNNLEGSFVIIDVPAVSKEEAGVLTVEEINAHFKRVTETPMSEGGLKGILGYQVVKSSRELIGSRFAGVFDPSKTQVDTKTGQVSIAVGYANEKGFSTNYTTLQLLTSLQQREVNKEIGIVAQNVVHTDKNKGANTSRVSVKTAIENGAYAVVVGSGQFRTLEHQANTTRATQINVNEEVNMALKETVAKKVKLPIFNIYVTAKDEQSGRIEDAINRQISEGLRDIAPEDIIKIAFSFEMENDKNLTPDALRGYINSIRKAIAGFVDRSPQAQELYYGKPSNLGANAAKKARVILRLNSTHSFHNRTEFEGNKLEDYLAIPGLDGLRLQGYPGYLTDANNVLTTEVLRGFANTVNDYLKNNSAKREELNKRYSPRFVFSVNSGSEVIDAKYVDLLSGAVDSYNVQALIEPVLPQIQDLSSVQRGQEPFNWQNVPSAEKVSVRMLLQNATLKNNQEGFINIYEVARLYKLHDVLFGHSEVIDLTGMSDEDIAQLVKVAHQLKKEGKITGNIIVAVGETLADYNAGSARSQEVIKQQVLRRTALLTPEEMADTVIAYEPRWAINTGKTPTVKEINDAHALIRNTVKAKYSLVVSQQVRILYGGSFSLNKKLDPEKEEAKKKTDAEVILRIEGVDGALVGGASTDPAELAQEVAIANSLADIKNAGQPYYRKLYIAGNHKAMPLKGSYSDFVAKVSPVFDRTKVEVALGPELSNIPNLLRVYMKNASEGIVYVDQLSDNEIKATVFFDRCDHNIPLDYSQAEPTDSRTWAIPDDAKLKLAVAEGKYIVERGGILVLMSHLEPKEGKFKDTKGDYSLRFLVPQLEKLYGRKVTFVSDILGRERRDVLSKARPGDIILFENLRYGEWGKQEKSKDKAVRDSFAKKLYAGRNEQNPTERVVIVKSGFGVMHRGDQASVDSIVPGVPVVGGMGLRKELELVDAAKTPTNKPIALIIGGGPKISEKIPMLKNIMLNTLPKGSTIFFYGAPAIVYLKAKDSAFSAGKSGVFATAENVEAMNQVIDLADKLGIEMVTADDFVVAEGEPADKSQSVATDVVSVNDVSPDVGIYDIGPKTLGNLNKELFNADGSCKFGRILGNGTVGMAVYPDFRSGNNGVFQLLLKAQKSGTRVIMGGSDTGLGMRMASDDLQIATIDDISTGGGAFLDALAGLGLPGVEAMRGKAGYLSYHLNRNAEEAFYRIQRLVSDYVVANATKASSAIITVTPEISLYGPHSSQIGLKPLYERIAGARKHNISGLRIKDIYAFEDQKHGMDPKESVSFGIVLEGNSSSKEDDLLIINQNAPVMGGISAGEAEPETHASIKEAISFFNKNVRGRIIGLNVGQPAEITAMINKIDNEFRSGAEDRDKPRFSYVGAEISVGVSMISAIALSEALSVPVEVVENYRYNEYARSQGWDSRPMSIPIDYGVLWEGGKHGVAKYLDELVKEGVITDTSRFPKRFSDPELIKKKDKTILLAMVPPQELQEMVIAPDWNQARHIGIKLTQNYQKKLKEKGIKTKYGAESGFTTEQMRTKDGKLITLELVLDILEETVATLPENEAKYVRFALDIAASEMYIPEIDMYYIGPEAAGNKDGLVNNAEFTQYKVKLFKKYWRFISCEDWAVESKPEHWDSAKQIMDNMINMGDDNVVSRADLIKQFTLWGVINAHLQKPNQSAEEGAGIEAVATSQNLGNVVVGSHRGTRSAQEVYTAQFMIGTGAFGGKWTLFGPGRGALIAAMTQADNLYNKGPFKNVKVSYQGALVLDPNGPYKDYGWAKRLRSEIKLTEAEQKKVQAISAGFSFTASSAMVTDNLGGIDMQKIKVGAALNSRPMNIPLSFDAAALQSLSFQIIRLEAIPNLKVFLGLSSEGEKQENLQLASVK